MDATTESFLSLTMKEPNPDQPQVTHRGRHNIPVAASNAEKADVLEFETLELKDRSILPDESPLNILEIDMLIATNAANHHTDKFSSNNLIVRRGQQFKVKLTFDRVYDPTKDLVQLEFRIGAAPQINKGTEVIIAFNSSKAQTGSWLGQLLTNTEDSVLMGVTPAPDCIVGKFSMCVAFVTSDGLARNKTDSKDVYILFNPWVSADSVFMADENERAEYVLNQVGIIYRGNSTHVTTKPWNYGQFGERILDACLSVMDTASIPLINRRNPIYVTRAASAQVNSLDDDGVLEGNWSGDYMNGQAPNSWMGSVDILLRYAAEKDPICFGQCWVYAGVFNTFLRCLGIPARVITNYNSAHDSDGNLKMDMILNQNGDIDMDNTKDSIWNFHCWNECFMTRPDLPAGFGGWQVVDATPQQTSDGLYRCGPASVYALKQGMICYPYDAPFIFAEVNSDIIFYKQNTDGTLTKINSNSFYIGKMLLTKGVGQNSPQNITSFYKYPEGSVEERRVLAMAEEFGCARNPSIFPDLDVELKLIVPDVRLGDDFQLTLEVKNLSTSLRTVDLVVSGSVVYYTGVISSEFMSTSLTVTVEPLMTLETPVDVRSLEYLQKLVEQANLNFITTGNINETDQNLVSMQVITLKSPKLTIQVTGNQKVNQNMFVTVQFKNLFSFQLENVTIRLEGLGLILPKAKQYSEIAPNASVMWTESFIPESPGKKTLIACLDCMSLIQSCDQLDVDIQP